ncbi:hypothetical protein RUM44_004394 [Polyplax serrata]|uniref:Uncharacterized protein n=1 Tax=Polyplax serrata TaxID=468196 RepID=A0ABR1B2R2_POLSC
MEASYSVLPGGESGIITEGFLKNLTQVDRSEEDSSDGNLYGDLLVAKVVSICVLGIVSFLVGLLPTQLAKWFNWNFDNGHQAKTNSNLVISLLLCFGGGVLMFTTFIHLQPEVREELDELIRLGKAPQFEQLADLVFCVGFFFVYLIEEIVHGILDRKQDHNDEETFLHRSVSLRKCNKGKDVNAESNQGIIPRVNLNQSNDGKTMEKCPKSISTQVLLDTSSVSTVHNSTGGTAFEQNYPSKYSHFDAEVAIIDKCGGYGPYSKSNERMDDGWNGKDVYEKNYNSVGKTSPVSHTHSHGFFDEAAKTTASGRLTNLTNTLRGFFTVLALSFHAVFEGLAVGLENEVSNVWYLFLAIATHKFVISFCVGVDLVSTRTKNLLIMLYLGTFAFVTPLGIGIGIGLSNDSVTSGNELSTLILQGMAAGTLLYVVFFEVLQREKANDQSGILQLIAIMAGFGVMFALQFASKFLVTDSSML